MKTRKASYFLIALAVCYGCYAMISQIVFIREYFVIAGGNELFVGLFFFTWFLGVAFGSRLSSIFSDRIEKPLLFAIILLFIQISFSFFDIFLIRSLRGIFQIPSGEQIPIMKFLAGTALSLFPFSFLTGFNFPLLCKSMGKTTEDDAPSIGRIYAADSLGSITGGALFTFILLRMFSPFPTLLLMGGALLGFAFLAIEGSGEIRRYFKVFVAISASIFIITSFSPAGKFLELTMQNIRWNSFAPGFNLINSRDTPYQHLSLAERDNQYSLLSNGSFVSSFPDPYGTETETHFVLSMCPEIKRILILGGGNPEILPVILNYPVERIDYVQMDAEALPFLKPYVSEKVSSALNDSRIRIQHEDARAFTRTSALAKRRNHLQRYDLVWVEIPEPDTAESNRFYTVDFYEDVREILSQKGVVVTQCSSAVNYFGKDVSEYVQSIYKSLEAVFEEIKITPGTRMYLFASPSRGALTLESNELIRRYESRGIVSDYFAPQLFSSMLEPFQINFTENSIRKNLDTIPLNFDLHPTTYLFNLRLWASRSGENIARGFDWILSLNIFHAVAFILILFITGMIVLSIKSKDRGAAIRHTGLYLIITTGICGMSTELVFLYLYQNIFGCLYQKIGLFAAFFMLGLTSGAWIAIRLIRKSDIRWRELRRLLLSIDFAYWLFLIVAGVGIPYWIPPEGMFYVSVLVFGVLTGIAFPLGGKAYLLSGAELGRASGRIDMADHTGAALGALLTGIVIIPALGIPMTLLLLAMLKLTSFSLIYLFK
ncbi:hypothetical protein JW926_02975 [Candidatus Sumerlaeota bacterium]|nr:hypothetical protein [Candidatus Sumerlaeota bacterium]